MFLINWNQSVLFLQVAQVVDFLSPGQTFVQRDQVALAFSRQVVKLLKLREPVLDQDEQVHFLDFVLRSMNTVLELVLLREEFVKNVLAVGGRITTEATLQVCKDVLSI